MGFRGFSRLSSFRFRGFLCLCSFSAGRKDLPEQQAISLKEGLDWCRTIDQKSRAADAFDS